MRDGPGRRTLKAISRALWSFDLRVDRAVRRWRREQSWQLGGDCRLCAACCEEPTIRVGRVLWHLGPLRRLFLAWQDRVNGFVLLRAEPADRSFVFRCTHFDPSTRRCDSYDSRPGMCRDYPRLLMWQPTPELLPGCGYRPVHPRAERFLAALDERELTPEQREKLIAGLHLEI